MTWAHLPAVVVVVVMLGAALSLLVGTLREVFGADRWPPESRDER